jgi:hypothetical protein
MVLVDSVILEEQGIGNIVRCGAIWIQAVLNAGKEVVLELRQKQLSRGQEKSQYLGLCRNKLSLP